jgi:hypothetical protein
VKVAVTAAAPYYGIKSRYGPHHNPQMDMLQGSDGWEYKNVNGSIVLDPTLSGLNTHGGLQDGCVTCHMQDRPNGQANHSMKMSGDTLGGFNATTVCVQCHGAISDFNDVKAFYDFDRNGRIEGVQTEVQGLMTQVAAMLPHDSTGALIATKSSLSKADSAKYNGRLDLVGATWNYLFVLNDASNGVHNAAYAVRLLYNALGWTPTWVKDYVGTTPNEYKLEQNYPNPFNPSTQIRFSLPKETRVRLDVYDVTGQLVKSLLNEGVTAGNKELTWDGTNNKGAKVSTGMYIYRLQADTFVSSKKMLLIK